MFSLKEWGVTEHHNAMVFDAETVELPDGKEETKVQVSSTYRCSSSCTLDIFRYISDKYHICQVICPAGICF